MSKTHANPWWWVVPGVLAGCACAVLVPPLFQSSNCGGNSAALAACGHHLAILQVWQHDNPRKVFRYEAASPELRAELAEGADWLYDARFLATQNDVRIDSAKPKQIVVVCNRAYANVPKGLLFKSPMKHAVGYSTGETSLISPSEFSQLDLAQFVVISEPSPKSSE